MPDPNLHKPGLLFASGTAIAVGLEEVALRRVKHHHVALIFEAVFIVIRVC